MTTLNEIRDELKEVKYYYSRQKYLDAAVGLVGVNEVMKTVHKYNSIACRAPIMLYDVYVCRIVKGLTQEATAMEFGIATDYSQKLYKQLLLYFQQKITEGGRSK